MMMVAFSLLAANQSHVFSVLPRGGFARFLTVVATQRSREASKTQRHKGRLNVKKKAALPIFKSFP